MHIYIIKSLFAVVLLSSLGMAESLKKFIPIMMDDMITFVIQDNRPDLYIASYTSNDDIVIVQKNAHLMWVNEPDESKGKCAKIHKETYHSDFAKAKGFCKSQQFGNFAGFSGWRTPTSSELKNFIIATRNMDVHYDAPCKKLLALKEGAVDESSDASYTTITTRYNSLPRGEDTHNIKPNFGLRCVRSMDE